MGISKLLLNKTVRRNIMLYLIVGYLPILAMFSVHLYITVNQHQESVKSDTLNKLEKVQIDIDNKIDSLSKANEHFSKTFGDVAIESQLKIYKSNYEFLDAVFYYDKQKNTMHSDEGVISYNDFASAYYKDANLYVSNFFVTILSSNKESVFSLRGLSDTNSSSGYIVYTAPVPKFSPNPTGAIIYLINIETIEEIYNSYLNKPGGSFAIFDNNNINTLYISSDEIHNHSEIQKILTFGSKSGIYEQNIGESPYIFASAFSEKINFRYSFAMLKASFFGTYQSVISSLLIIAIVVAALILLLSTFMALYQYDPIRKILQQFDISVGANGYEDISNHCKRIQHVQNELLVQITEYTQFAKYNALLRLLNANMHNIDFYLKCCNLDFIYNKFIVYSFAPEAIDSIDLNEECVLEIDLRYGKGFGVELLSENIFCVLINYDDSLDEFSEKEMEATIHESIKRIIFGSFESGIGCTATKLSDINISFILSLDEMNRKKQGVQAESSVQSQMLSQNPVFKENLLRANREKTLEIFAESRDDFALTHSEAELNEFYFDTIAYLNKLGEQYGIFFEAIRSDSGAEEYICKFIEQICFKIQERKDDMQRALSEGIINYINDNFRKESLSLCSVASVFAVSRNRISQIIKQETGLPFLQYITDLRIAFVKDQLKNTEKSVNDIILSAGYINPSSFIRKFKKVEGVPPGVYRNIVSPNSLG